MKYNLACCCSIINQQVEWICMVQTSNNISFTWLNFFLGVVGLAAMTAKITILQSSCFEVTQPLTRSGGITELGSYYLTLVI